MANKDVQYEEIDGVNYIIKDSSKKMLVVFYQNMVRDSYDHYVSLHRIIEKKKAYADAMLENMSSAPFRLGWLQRENCVIVEVAPKGLIKRPEKEPKKKIEAIKNLANPTKSVDKKETPEPIKMAIKGLDKGSKKVVNKKEEIAKMVAAHIKSKLPPIVEGFENGSKKK